MCIFFPGVVFHFFGEVEVVRGHRGLEYQKNRLESKHSSHSLGMGKIKSQLPLLRSILRVEKQAS